MGFSGAIVLILLIGGFAYLSTTRFSENANWVKHTYEVMGTIKDLNMAVAQAESAGRCFLIYGNKDFRTRYDTFSLKINDDIRVLRNLVLDNPRQGERIHDLLIAVRVWMKDLDEKIALRNERKDGVELDLLLAQGLAANITHITDEMLIEERMLLVKRESADIESKSVLHWVNLLGTLLNLVLVVFLIRYIQKTLHQRLKVEGELKTSNAEVYAVSKENAERNWVLTGALGLNRELWENKLILLSQNIIGFLANYMHVQLGALYLMNEDEGALSLTASLGQNMRKANGFVPLKEGLVGQAAYEKRMIVFSNVPDDNIQSGLRETTSKHTIVVPFLFENSVKGVVELGAILPFSDEQMEFLQFVGKDIGIAIAMAQGWEKMHVLHTQLKQQVETLQQANMELDEKVQQLKENNERLEIAQRKVEGKAAELERNSRYKSEFLANMGHELRTPLNSILILSKLLSDNKNSNLTDKQIEFALVIHRSGNELLTLINDVLNLLKIELGEQGGSGDGGSATG